jgi:hypothetical protein
VSMVLTRQQPYSRGISLVAQFVRDLEKAQDRTKQPLKVKAIGRILNEWRGYDGSEVFFRTLPAQEQDKRLSAYHATMTDREAAAHVGLSQVQFYRWRHWKGLPSKGTPGLKAGYRRIKGVVVYDNRL